MPHNPAEDAANVDSINHVVKNVKVHESSELLGIAPVAAAQDDAGFADG